MDDKEIEMIKNKKMKQMIDKQNSAKTKAREFAQAILDCEEYKNFIKCSEVLEKSQMAQNLLKKFQEKQMELKRNGFNPNTFQELNELQEQINKNEVIQNFQKTQEELTDLLRNTNDIISGDIGAQFAFSQRGGCCG